MKNNVLVTGAAGFIGFHLCRRLASEGYRVTGLDNINSYYDKGLKYARLRKLGIMLTPDGKSLDSTKGMIRFVEADLCDRQAIDSLFATGDFDVVVNLAAQAGVRYSIENPRAYIESNIEGFLNILEGCRLTSVGHLVYASSSSVYGLNGHIPYRESDSTAHPVSVYAATKKADELLAHTYSHIYGLPTTGLRFFTVYGPWGRPDMSPTLFAKAIFDGTPIKVFNHGRMMRDFTYIDDIIDGIVGVIGHAPKGDPDWNANSETPDPSRSRAPYRILNIGNSQAVNLLDFIEAIEKASGRKAIKVMTDMQPGDVEKTWADTTNLDAIVGNRHHTPLSEGVGRFIEWFANYYSSAKEGAIASAQS